jgi:mono/diheme cytochrome c family protein
MPRSVMLAAVLSCFVFSAAADDSKVIKKVPTSQTSPSSGKEMFNNYCAVCHGRDARGGGPAASALKKTPTYLTTLAARNHGKFPELRVFSTIQGDSESSAHGSRDMPIWGNVFQEMSHGSAGEVQMRISNLVAFIETLQAK